MPRGDRTGPGGEGPETGRGAGWCRSGDRPGYESAPGFGRGRGWRVRGSGENWFQAGRERWFLPSRSLRSERAERGTEGYSLIDRFDRLITLIEKLNAARKNKE